MDALPLLTADLPGIGGVIKHVPEDFQVEEIPAYEPCGDGEHLFLWIEKRDVSAERLVEHVARSLGVARQDIGVAGLKDRRAVTRQYISVPAHCRDTVTAIDTDGIRVLQSTLHRNKLRTGHLHGNRFSVLVRDVVEGATQRAQAIAKRLELTGFPNYYGEQRFGNEGETLTLGFDLLAARKNPRDLPKSRRKFLLRLALSAVQSALFNESLVERITAGRFHRIEPGDVIQVVASGGLFVAEHVTAEQERFDAGETVPAGPVFGPKMKPAGGAPGAREQSLLKRRGLTIDAFRRFPKLTRGARRPYVVRPQRLAVTPDPAGIRLEFALPPGAYATVLLREFMDPVVPQQRPTTGSNSPCLSCLRGSD